MISRGRPCQPDAEKQCERCGTTFTRLGLRLDWKAWAVRRFCGAACHRPVIELPERRLTSAEHYAYWTERFTHEQICELAAYLDFLSFERSDRVRAA